MEGEEIMVQKGTIEWYRYVEQSNTLLRGRLLAHIPKLSTESSQEWLRRVNVLYQKSMVK